MEIMKGTDCVGTLVLLQKQKGKYPTYWLVGTPCLQGLERNLMDNFTGGLRQEFDYALTTASHIPNLVETFNNWFYDGPKDIGMNLHLHGITAGRACERASLFLPDGRILITQSEGTFTNGNAPGGTNLRLHCEKPFRSWRYRWTGKALVTTEEQQARGLVCEGPTTHVDVDIRATTQGEPWIIPLSTGPGNQSAAVETQSDFLGKYEQLVKAVGQIKVATESWNFEGVGLRAHVRGLRDMTGMKSHAWVCGFFPGGRGFGLKVLNKECNIPYFSEAYIFENQQVHRAKVLQVPVLDRVPKLPPYTVILKSALGTAHIKGKNVKTTWIPVGTWNEGKPGGKTKSISLDFHGLVVDCEVLMSQSCSVFEWDNEVGYGMCELSG